MTDSRQQKRREFRKARLYQGVSEYLGENTGILRTQSAVEIWECLDSHKTATQQRLWFKNTLYTMRHNLTAAMHKAMGAVTINRDYILPTTDAIIMRRAL